MFLYYFMKKQSKLKIYFVPLTKQLIGVNIYKPDNRDYLLLKNIDYFYAPLFPTLLSLSPLSGRISLSPFFLSLCIYISLCLSVSFISLSVSLKVSFCLTLSL